MPGGIFATWQPEYARYGIATFPVGPTKKPAIRGYLRIGLKASSRIVPKFLSSSALGFALGRQSGVAVLDVDSNDEKFLEDCLNRYGATPVIVQSGSGHFQAWYKSNGERRLIRPRPDVPVDILGGGFVVAPPSEVHAGKYVFISGSLEQLSRLPIMQRAAFTARTQRPANLRILNGRRNISLFRYALEQAPFVDDEESLLDKVSNENESRCLEQLEDEEVLWLVASAWKYQVEGRNLVGKRYVPATHDEIDDLGRASPDAFTLLMQLRRWHVGRSEFVLAKAFAFSLKWSLPRFRTARRLLEERGHILCLHRGGIGPRDPPIYCLRGVDSRHNK
jgi:hypothetical protein